MKHFKKLCKEDASKTNNTLCAILYLFNLASPQLYKVSCGTKKVQLLVWSGYNVSNETETQNSNALLACGSDKIRHSKLCLRILWPSSQAGCLSVKMYMYKCEKTKSTCVHVGTVCDKIWNCPHGDDKILSELKSVTCLGEGYCHAFILTGVKTMRLVAPKHQFPFKHISLQATVIESFVFTSFPAVISIQLLKLNLTEIEVCCSNFSQSTCKLDVSQNIIYELGRHCTVLKRQLQYIPLN